MYITFKILKFEFKKSKTYFNTIFLSWSTIICIKKNIYKYKTNEKKKNIILIK